MHSHHSLKKAVAFNLPCLSFQARCMKNRDRIIKWGGGSQRESHWKAEVLLLASSFIKPADTLYWSDGVFITSCGKNQSLAYSKDL